MIIEGYLEPTQTAGLLRCRPTRPTGTLAELSRVDVARFAKQYDGDVAPGFYVQLTAQDPADRLRAAAAGAPPDPRRGSAPQLRLAVGDLHARSPSSATRSPSGGGPARVGRARRPPRCREEELVA